MSVLLVFSSALYPLLDEAVHCPHPVSSGGVHGMLIYRLHCLAILLEETLMQCNSSQRPGYFEQSVLNKICPGIMRVSHAPVCLYDMLGKIPLLREDGWVELCLLK